MIRVMDSFDSDTTGQALHVTHVSSLFPGGYDVSLGLGDTAAQEAQARPARRASEVKAAEAQPDAGDQCTQCRIELMVACGCEAWLRAVVRL